MSGAGAGGANESTGEARFLVNGHTEGEEENEDDEEWPPADPIHAGRREVEVLEDSNLDDRIRSALDNLDLGIRSNHVSAADQQHSSSDSSDSDDDFNSVENYLDDGGVTMGYMPLPQEPNDQEEEGEVEEEEDLKKEDLKKEGEEEEGNAGEDQQSEATESEDGTQASTSSSGDACAAAVATVAATDSQLKEGAVRYCESGLYYNIYVCTFCGGRQGGDYQEGDGRFFPASVCNARVGQARSRGCLEDRTVRWTAWQEA